MRRELIVKEEPKSPISEVFRTLRTNIQFMNNRKKLQSLLITSTVPGEGKSWISSNLATTFAQAGKKVILLDADMRKGRQYNIFGISPRPGLSNYLSGLTDDEQQLKLQDYIQETEVENLYVIPAGNIPPNPAELLVSENMVNLLENLKEMCDVVIVDGPPTQLVTDSLILTRIVDSTVIVVASNETKKDSLHRVIDNIQKIGGQIAGVVVNKVQVSTKKYKQTYYYSSTENKNKKSKNRQTKKMDIKRRAQIENRNKEMIENLEQRIKDDIELPKTEIPENIDLPDFGKSIFNESQIEKNETNVAEIERLVNDISEIEKTISKKEEDKEQIFNTVEQRFNTVEMRSQQENNIETPQKTELEKIIENDDTKTSSLIQKTEDIIRQMNEYIETEKKNLDNN